MRLGDLPTWFAAIGTVGALAAAFWQIRVERRHRLARDAAERQEYHVAQAVLISAMVGPEEGEPLGDPTQGRTAIDMFNGSPEPVYGLVVCIVFIQGAAPRSTEDMIELRTQIEPYEGMPLTTVSILPPGTWRAWINGTGWTAILAGRPGAEIAFTDLAGSHWIRRATGNLEELPENPLTYFEKWRLFGPHDLQRPERLG